MNARLYLFLYQAVSLKEFQVFEDKANAINSNGVCSKLANMIKRSLRPGQKLAVGKQEYKDIIEASLVSVSFLCM
jgi:nucleolar protein 58